MDVDLQGQPSQEITLAGVAPLFFKVAPSDRVDAIVKTLKDKFVQPGGVVTTLKETGQQWDSPNGWAPLQWLTIQGLRNYGQDDLAKDLAERWMKLNVKVYKATGKLMEKYDVMDLSKAAGGEYPSRDGFGWTNGVFLELVSLYRMPAGLKAIPNCRKHGLFSPSTLKAGSPSSFSEANPGSLKITPLACLACAKYTSNLRSASAARMPSTA